MGKKEWTKEGNDTLPGLAFTPDVFVEANSLLRAEGEAAAFLRSSISAEECLLAGEEQRASVMFGDVVFNKRAVFKLL